MFIRLLDAYKNALLFREQEPTLKLTQSLSDDSWKRVAGLLKQLHTADPEQYARSRDFFVKHHPDPTAFEKDLLAFEGASTGDALQRVPAVAMHAEWGTANDIVELLGRRRSHLGRQRWHSPQATLVEGESATATKGRDNGDSLGRHYRRSPHGTSGGDPKIHQRPDRHGQHHGHAFRNRGEEASYNGASAFAGMSEVVTESGLFAMMGE